MNQRGMKDRVMVGALIVLILSIGCATALRNKQLERIAKDWSLVIRASQIIPVYPLSEDLQPGDVLLVSTPIEDQVAIYKNKGFLPLDQHFVRLYSKDYFAFYRGRYGIADRTVTPPEHWQKQEANSEQNWKSAPLAAFPTYQFSVRTGSGLNLAIPVQGIPFALGLMNSGAASGTVTIADAHTYGLDNVRVERLVRDWAVKKRGLLRDYEPHGSDRHYLRVVSRVYVTGRVSVTINNDEATSAGAAAGADRPVELMGVKEGSTREDFTKAMAAINNLAKNQLPGVKVKIATASSRSVTLSEKFDRPLVIGYIGFDIPIEKGGRLGPAISTLAQLKGERTIPVTSNGNVYRLAALSHMYQALRDIPGDEAALIRAELDTLADVLPKTYPFSLYEYTSATGIEKDSSIVAGAAVEKESFQSVLDFQGNAQTTIETLTAYLPTASDATPAERQAAATLEQELKSARAALEDVSVRLNLEPAVMQAVDFVFLGA